MPLPDKDDINSNHRWTQIDTKKKTEYFLLTAHSMPHQHWLGKLANLNASKSAGRGIAPHKPLMMFI